MRINNNMSTLSKWLEFPLSSHETRFESYHCWFVSKLISCSYRPDFASSVQQHWEVSGDHTTGFSKDTIIRHGLRRAATDSHAKFFIVHSALTKGYTTFLYIAIGINWNKLMRETSNKLFTRQTPMTVHICLKTSKNLETLKTGRGSRNHFQRLGVTRVDECPIQWLVLLEIESIDMGIVKGGIKYSETRNNRPMRLPIYRDK